MKEDSVIQPDTPTILFIVGEGTYLDNGKVHVTNNDQHGDAVMFSLVICPENLGLNIPGNMLLEANKTATIAIDTQLRQGAQILLRTSSANLTAKVEGNIVHI